jgi:20S proteasome subunit beta 4
VNLLLGGVIPGNSQPAPQASPAAPGAPVTTSGTSGPITPITKPVPKLYWLDYLAASAEVPYAAHGYAQYYCLSILDKHHHPDIDLEQGLKLLRMCAEELKRRMPVDFKGLTVKVVTPEGVKVIEELGERKDVVAP